MDLKPDNIKRTPAPEFEGAFTEGGGAVIPDDYWARRGPGSGIVVGEDGRTWEVPASPFQPQSGVTTPPNMAPKAIRDRAAYRKGVEVEMGQGKRPQDLSTAEISGGVDRLTKEHEKDLFEGLFGDNARFEDRNQLDPAWQKAWKAELLQARKKMEVQVVDGYKRPQEEWDRKDAIIKDRVKAYDLAVTAITPTRPKAPSTIQAATKKEQKKESASNNKKVSKAIEDLKKARKTSESTLTKGQHDQIEDSLKGTGYELKRITDEEAVPFIKDKTAGFWDQEAVEEKAHYEVRRIGEPGGSEAPLFNPVPQDAPDTTVNYRPSQGQAENTPAEGQTATHPTTGERLKFINGVWEPM